MHKFKQQIENLSNVEVMVMAEYNVVLKANASGEYYYFNFTNLGDVQVRTDLQTLESNLSFQQAFKLAKELV
jgi:hypothetical protein|tara:strand:- start:8089 stop:8304 length:216 start_codon:yes stop_codon:yes gene_type:complete